jgi:hypothetical protein
MTVNTKIVVLLLLASVIGLSSCVNEVKNTLPPQAPIDTNYLHGFTKVKISFFGTLQYFDHVTDYTGKFIDSQRQYIKPVAFGSQSNFPDFYISVGGSSRDFIITWKGNFFYIDGNAYYDTSYSWNGNPYTEVGISGGERFLFFGAISRSGNQIDSLHGSYKAESDFINMHYEEIDTAKQYIELKQLPNFMQNSDTLVFSATGKQLQSIINVLNDRSFQRYNEDVIRLHELRNIIWNAQVAPVLTVKFYK